MKLGREFPISQVYAADFETKLIGPQCLAPEPICFSVANKEQGAFLVSNGDGYWEDYLKGLIDAALEDPEMTIVFHNAKFDAHVLCNKFPEYYHKVCRLYDRDQIICSILVEKLLNLTTTGWVDKEPKADEEEAKGKKLDYGLSDLIKKYLGIDISMEKEAEDAVRLRYQELDGIASRLYPKEFSDYAINDSYYLLQVFELQMEKREAIIANLGIDPLVTLGHRCRLDFHLYRWSIEGVRTSSEQIKFMEGYLEEELSYEKLNLLYPEEILTSEDLKDLRKADKYLNLTLEKCILRPAVPERISYRWSHKKDCPKTTDPETGILTCTDECFPKPAKDHHEDCKRKSCKFTRDWLCDCPDKLVKEQTETLNTKVLKQHIVDLWKNDPQSYDLLFSDAAEKDEEFLSKWDDYKYGRISIEEAYELISDNLSYLSTKREWLDTYSFKDPILAQFDHRAGLIKLKTTEIPRMKDETGEISPIVHGNFDVLKETGRTSGYASKLYPSANLQNIHKMARTFMKSREGHWILSTDYSGLEFVSAAQRALDLLGESMYAKIINNGWDPHAYLAAQQAFRQEDWFAKECFDKGIDIKKHEGIYHHFFTYKKNDKQIGFEEGKVDDQGNPVPKYFFDFYRNSAKPIGLGRLGGMGAKTVAHVSGATYKINMSQEEAKEYCDLWSNIFGPEDELLRMVNRDMKDVMFSSKKKSKFRYETPMGMVRPNCSYAACANGSILQSPSAEGATLACIDVGKKAYDKAEGHMFYGNFFPWAFVHDEILGDVVADASTATAVAKELEKLMIDNLKLICPDINPSADSALMISWSKKAKDVYNKDGLLVPWEVTKDNKLAKELNYD